jgi:hypothetical protein
MSQRRGGQWERLSAVQRAMARERAAGEMRMHSARVCLPTLSSPFSAVLCPPDRSRGRVSGTPRQGGLRCPQDGQMACAGLRRAPYHCAASLLMPLAVRRTRLQRRAECPLHSSLRIRLAAGSTVGSGTVDDSIACAALPAASRVLCCRAGRAIHCPRHSPFGISLRTANRSHDASCGFQPRLRRTSSSLSRR